MSTGTSVGADALHLRHDLPERPVLSHDLVDDLAPPEPPEEIAGGRLGGLAEPLELVELPVVSQRHRQRLQRVGERLDLAR